MDTRGGRDGAVQRVPRATSCELSGRRRGYWYPMPTMGYKVAVWCFPTFSVFSGAKIAVCVVCLLINTGSEVQ